MYYTHSFQWEAHYIYCHTDTIILESYYAYYNHRKCIQKLVFAKCMSAQTYNYFHYLHITIYGLSVTHLIESTHELVVRSSSSLSQRSQQVAKRDFEEDRRSPTILPCHSVEDLCLCLCSAESEL